MVHYIKGMKIEVDEEDYQFLVSHNWTILKARCKKKKYYVLLVGRDKNKKIKTFYFHREIMGVEQGQYIDHINGNSLDCRKQNLRICTPSQNAFNRSPRKDKYKGVTLRKYKSGKKSYRVAISFKGKFQWIGTFKTADEGAIAYNKRAIELFGQFANLNKIKY